MQKLAIINNRLERGEEKETTVIRRVVDRGSKNPITLI